jgi:hypothetical protein
LVVEHGGKGALEEVCGWWVGWFVGFGGFRAVEKGERGGHGSPSLQRGLL